MDAVAWALAIVVVCILVVAVLVVVFSTPSPNASLIHWDRLERQRSEKAELLQLDQQDKPHQLQRIWTQALAPPPVAAHTTAAMTAALTRLGFSDLSRGIVVTAGGPELTRQARQLFLELRATGCLWPIQLWYRRHEIDSATLHALETDCRVTAHCFEVEAPTLPCENRFSLKILALYLCPFATCLYLDADNHVRTDPSFLADLPAVQATGALFWPDLSPLNHQAPCFQSFTAAQLARLPAQQQNSAQLVLKLTPEHRTNLWSIYRLLENQLEALFPAPYNYGDKDMFHATWVAHNHPFSWVEGRSLEILDANHQVVALAHADPRDPDTILFVQDTVPQPQYSALRAPGTTTLLPAERLTLWQQPPLPQLVSL